MGNSAKSKIETDEAPPLLVRRESLKRYSLRDVVPQQIFGERYELLEKLGSGAFSTVHLATDRLSQAKVAVKIIDREKISQQTETYFRREVEIQKSLNHPNIVKVYICYEELDHFYLVLELVEGGELFDRILQRTRYTENCARDILYNLLVAVKYCHDQGVVHRDIKPENILISKDENDSNIKLADFGFATYDHGTNSLTASCGTPGYVAPEILKRDLYGAAVDMWAVGVVAFVLIGGYLPFHDKDERKRRALIRSGMYDFNPTRWSNVSQEAKGFISLLLVVDPAARLTAKQALQHSWILKEKALLEARPLDSNLLELQAQIRNRRFKAATRAIIALQRLGSGSKMGGSTFSFTNLSVRENSAAGPEHSQHSQRSGRADLI